MSGSVVLPCTCRHAFQDQRYGQGMRLHAMKRTAPKSAMKACCTVCSAEHYTGKETPELPGKKGKV